MGVPKYQTKQLVKLVAFKYGHLGMAFLLAASLLGFSTVYKRKIVKAQQGTDDRSSQTTTKETL
jgi:hypothetical protein